MAISVPALVSDPLMVMWRRNDTFALAFGAAVAVLAGR
jgi:hypothetical protein